MPGLNEVLFYVSGVFDLGLGQSEGFRKLDFTNQGVKRSFWALGWSLPFLFVTWIFARMDYLQRATNPVDPGKVIYFRFFMIDMAIWFLPLLLMLVFLSLTKQERYLPRVVVINNWISLPIAALSAVIALLEILIPSGHGIWIYVWSFQLGIAIAWLYRAMKMVYDGNTVQAITTTFILFAPAILIADYLRSFLGVGIA